MDRRDVIRTAALAIVALWAGKTGAKKGVKSMVKGGLVECPQGEEIITPKFIAAAQEVYIKGEDFRITLTRNYLNTKRK